MLLVKQDYWLAYNSFREQNITCKYFTNYEETLFKPWSEGGQRPPEKHKIKWIKINLRNQTPMRNTKLSQWESRIVTYMCQLGIYM